jgi:hypothetical protein
MAEKHDRDAELSRLEDFMGTPAFAELPEAEQARMTRQCNLMAQLSAVLGERIDAFSA